jgi:hypothetical protein
VPATQEYGDIKKQMGKTDICHKRKSVGIKIIKINHTTKYDTYTQNFSLPGMRKP